MYHFTEQLRVFRAITKLPENAKLLESSRFIVLEHILQTTGRFITLLHKAGADINAIVAKPYSKDAHVLQRLKSSFNVIEESYETLETTEVLHNLIKKAAEESQSDGRHVILLDVGGYFAKPLSELDPELLHCVVGVVEDTTFGHNRYIKAAKEIPVPICSVARSELKEIGARFVGRDAVQAVDHILRELGISITGRNALVIGYGMIGRNVARNLRSYDLNVYVYDIEDRQLLKAYTDGFHIHKKVVLLRAADIILSATGSEAIYGRPAMSFEEIEDCKNGIILVSVGSKDTEFDVASLKRNALKKIDLGHYLERFEMPNSKDVILAKEGTAINFILPSMAVEILDLVFSEILETSLSLLRRDDSLERGIVNSSRRNILNRIPKAWLRSVNVEAVV